MRESMKFFNLFGRARLGLVYVNELNEYGYLVPEAWCCGVVVL